MAQQRGLGELELHLRTVLLQRMAGQSREIVDRTIQTTRLVVGYFRLNARKSREELIAEAVALAPRMREKKDGEGEGESRGRGREESRRSGGGRGSEGGVGSKSKATSATPTPADLAEYEELRRFIFSRFLATSMAKTRSTCRTQLFSEALWRAKLGMEELLALYTRNRTTFVRVLRQRMIDAYHSVGPREVSFDEFATFVAAFIESMRTEKSKVPTTECKPGSTSALGIPLWYQCRQCKAIAKHWSSDCTLSRKIGMSDVEQVSDLVSQYRYPFHNGRCLDELAQLRCYLRQRMEADLGTAPVENKQHFAERLSFAIVHGMATHNIGPGTLKEYTENQLFHRIHRSLQDFPKCVSAAGMARIVQDFLGELGRGGSSS